MDVEFVLPLARHLVRFPQFAQHVLHRVTVAHHRAQRRGIAALPAALPAVAVIEGGVPGALAVPSMAQAHQDDPTTSDLEELSLKLNAVEVAHYKALEAATPEPKGSSDTAMREPEDGIHGDSNEAY